MTVNQHCISVENELLVLNYKLLGIRTNELIQGRFMAEADVVKANNQAVFSEIRNFRQKKGEAEAPLMSAPQTCPAGFVRFVLVVVSCFCVISGLFDESLLSTGGFGSLPAIKSSI